MAMRLVRKYQNRPRPKSYRRVRFAGKLFLLHRLVMETLLGRGLGTSEHVHHIDGNKWNNLPGNLMLLSHAAHASLSARRHPLVRFCRWCGEPFIPTHVSWQRPQACCSRSCGTSRQHHQRRLRAP